MNISWYIVLSSLLFATGVLGILIRRSPMVILLCLELMLNAGNLALVAFSRMVGNGQGQVFAVIVMVIAACEVVVGLGLIVAIFRRKLPLNVDDLRELRGRAPPLGAGWFCSSRYWGRSSSRSASKRCRRRPPGRSARSRSGSPSPAASPPWSACSARRPTPATTPPRSGTTPASPASTSSSGSSPTSSRSSWSSSSPASRP